MKSHIRCEFKKRLGLQRDSQVINNIINCWVVVAKSLKMVFSHYFTELDYEALKSILNEERDILVKVCYSKINNDTALFSNELNFFYINEYADVS